MLRFASRKISFAPAVLPVIWLAASSCKPVGGEASRILETGGTVVDWRVKSTVSGTGELKLVKNGTGADFEAATITDVAVEVSSAPDGTVPAASVVASAWIPLAVGTDDLKFNLLMTTRNLGLCYVNTIALNGSNDQVTCKDAPAAATTAGPNDPKVVEMREACKRLAKTPIDPTKPSELYAKFDEKLNQEKCTCLNGKERDLFYESFLGAKATAATDFEDGCKKALEATDTATGTSINTTYVDYLKEKEKEKTQEKEKTTENTKTLEKDKTTEKETERDKEPKTDQTPGKEASSNEFILE